MLAQLRLSHYLVPSLLVHSVAVAMICHVLHGRVEPAQLGLQRGESAVRVCLVPSKASRAVAVKRAPQDPVRRFTAQDFPVSPLAERRSTKVESTTALATEEAPVIQRGVGLLSLPAVRTVKTCQRPTRMQRPNPPVAAITPCPVNSQEQDADLRAKGAQAVRVVGGMVKPEYPRLSRKRGEEGIVVLSVEVHANGSQGCVRLVRSSGYHRLDQAAMNAVKRARFLPARLNGRPVDSRREFSFAFRLVDA